MKPILTIILLLTAYFGLAQKAPSALNATAKSSTQIDLTWTDNSTDETGFDLQWGTSTAYGTGTISYAKNVQAGSISGLKEATTYYFRVRAKTTTSFSAWITASATTLKPAKNPPAAPAALSLSAVSATQIDAFWKDNSSNETGFKWECATDGAFGKIVKSGNNGVNDTNVSITGLNPSTPYYVRVWAYNTDGESAKIDSKTTTPDVAKNPPAAPTSFTATAVSTSQINLNWKRGSTNETGFKWECYDPNKKLVKSGNTAAGIVTGSVTGLNANTTYVINLWAYNSDGNSGVVQGSATTMKVQPAAAPTNLEITINNTGDQAIVNWKDNSNNETGFDIEWGESMNYGNSNSVTANITSFQIKNLTPCRNLYVKVRAKNNEEFSSFTNKVTSTTIAIPAVPSNLTLSAITGRQIKASWMDNSNNEAEFLLQLDTSSDFSKPANAAIKANETSFIITGLTPQTTYYIRIQAKNCAGESVWTNNNTFATTLSPPNAPTNLQIAVNPSGQEAKLTWTDNSNDEDGFEIEWGLSKTDKNPSNFDYYEKATVLANSTSFSLEKLKECSVVFVRILAKNGNGRSAYTTNKASTNIPVPAAPSNLSLLALNSNEIKATWKDNASNEEEFVLQMDENSNFSNPIESKETANTQTRTFSNLKPNTSYYIRLKTRNCGGESAWVDSKIATLALPKPDSPTSLQAGIATSDKISLQWVDNSANEEAFEIHRANSSNGVFVKIGETAQNNNSFTDTALTPSTQYCYKILAKNFVGNSAFSNTICANTEPLPQTTPLAPKNLLTKAISSNKIELSWENQSENESGFEIERANTETGVYSKIAEVAAKSKLYIDENLTENTQYCYQVRAINTAGKSDFSNKSCSKTLEKALTKLSAPKNLKKGANTNEVNAQNLVWENTNTVNCHIELWRSVGDDDQYSLLETLKTEPTATNFTDKNLRTGTTYYYKVRAVQTGGEPSTWSNILKITAPIVSGNEQEISFKTYPNPVIDILTIDIGNLKSASINLFSLKGELLNHRKTNFQNLEILDLTTYKTGVYLLNISTKESTKTIKIFKQ